MINIDISTLHCPVVESQTTLCPLKSTQTTPALTHRSSHSSIPPRDHHTSVLDNASVPFQAEKATHHPDQTNQTPQRTNHRLDLAQRPPTRQPIPLATPVALLRRPHRQRTGHIRRRNRQTAPSDQGQRNAGTNGIQHQLGKVGCRARGRRHTGSVGASRQAGEVRLQHAQVRHSE